MPSTRFQCFTCHFSPMNNNNVVFSSMNMIVIIYLYLFPVRLCGSCNDDNNDFLAAFWYWHWCFTFISSKYIKLEELELMSVCSVITVDNAFSDLILGCCFVFFFKLYIYWISENCHFAWCLQYISLLFIGMLVVISVRGFLANVMKVSFSAEFNFYLYMWMYGFWF